MSDVTGAFPPGGMAWILGIEDTCVRPPAHFAMADLDEFALTDHDARWRQDLELVRELGATSIRYGVGWPRVHTAPGVFDWSTLDERIAFAAGELGLTVIADLVHYGTPTWLAQSFADPGYPDAIAEFTAAFAGRYRGLVDHLTPLNEPVTTASFCGLRGVWPPALSGWPGWTTVTLAIVEGIRASIAAARAANPDVVIVHVEASAMYDTADEGLRQHAGLLAATADLPLDLLLGRVGPEHPMFGWLLEHGARAEALAVLQGDVPVIDLLGVNYYPDLTPRTLVRVGDGVEQLATNRWQEGLRACLTRFARRCPAPLLLTETSIEGDEGTRADWVTSSARAVLDLRDEGLDIRGYTWWPLFDFVDWSFASGGRNVEEFLLDRAQDGSPGSAAHEVFGDVAAGRSAFLRRMGLVALREEPDGSLARVPTSAAPAFRALTARERAEEVAPDGR